MELPCIMAGALWGSFKPCLLLALLGGSFTEPGVSLTSGSSAFGGDQQLTPHQLREGTATMVITHCRGMEWTEGG